MFVLFLIKQQTRGVVGVLLCLRLADKNHRLKVSGLAVLNMYAIDCVSGWENLRYACTLSRVFILFIALKAIRLS
jgi:hypothetical protein